jgi:hypothetical protein
VMPAGVGDDLTVVTFRSTVLDSNLMDRVFASTVSQSGVESARVSLTF